jgi:hypothetical protein
MKTKQNGEFLVETYLSTRNLRLERFAKFERIGRRTPDFKAFRADELVFYCEVKTIQRDPWFDEVTQNCQPGTARISRRSDPTYNRLANHIHEAYEQLSSVNLTASVANVLAFVNCDRQCGVIDLHSVLSGNAYCSQTREAIPAFKQFSEGRIRDEKFSIDLYLWFSSLEDANPAMTFSAPESEHAVKLANLFDVDLRRLLIFDDFKLTSTYHD